VDGASNVTIATLTVDGSVADSGAVLVPNCFSLPFYIGIFYRVSSGNIDAAQVTGITSSKACADAIRAENGNVAITRNLVNKYGRAGIGCVGPNGNCTITGNTVQGVGKVDNQTQSGIQVRGAAGGVIAGNVIMDNFLIGAHGVTNSSVGIALFYAQPTTYPHLETDNVFANNQVNIQRQSTAPAFCAQFAC
jgi:parallel beta helix pectate lyase-like protein